MESYPKPKLKYLLFNKLSDQQKKHLNQLETCLASFPVALDLSKMGTGKTFVSSAFYQKNEFDNIMVVCPKSVVPAWEKIFNDYFIKNYNIQTFEKLRTFLPLSNNKSTDLLFDKGKKETIFLIIDEGHKTKNDGTSTQKSVEHLIRNILSYNENNRVIIASGTLFDKVCFTFSFLKTLGISKDGIREKISEDIESFISSHSYGKDDDEDFKPIPKKLSDEELFIIFNNRIKPLISSRMEEEEVSTTIKLKPINLIMNFKDTSNDLYSYLKRLNGVSGDFLQEKDKEKKESIFGEMTKILRDIEIEKSEYIFNLFRKISSSSKNPVKKIVFGFNYTASLKKFEELFKENIKYLTYKVVTGSTSTDERAETFKSFRENTDECNVILANLKVISTGVSLDDESGEKGYERWAFANPSYNATDQHQFSYRFFRKQTKSNSNIFFIYSYFDEKINEEKILKSLKSKGGTMKTIIEGVETSEIFSDDYDKCIVDII